MTDLTTTTTDRGFDHHAPAPSEYGGEVRVSESNNASYAGIWLRATAPVNLNDPDGDTHEVPINLTGRNAWTLARQLAHLVVNHYQGDTRPCEALMSARDAIVTVTGWSPGMAHTLARRLAHLGFVLVDIGAPKDQRADTDAEPQPATLLVDEPEDGALFAYLMPDGEIDVMQPVYLRNDQAAEEGDYGDQHWYPIGKVDDEYPETWEDVSHDLRGQRVRLHHDQLVPAGVKVYQEWGVHSDDGDVYQVNGDHDTAVREAVLLRNGVPGDPERTPEPGAAPASRYVLDTPHGTVTTGWRWPARWTPPPESLLVTPE